MSKKNKKEDYQFLLKVHSDRTLKQYYVVEFLKSEIQSFDPTNVVIPTLKNEDKSIFTKFRILDGR